MDPCFGPSSFRRGVIATSVALLTGCAAIPRERAAADINNVLVARGAPQVAWRTTPAPEAREDARVAELLSQPLGTEQAVELAFIRNARIREAYAGLGIAQADVLDAVRLSNPTFGYIDLEPRGGAEHHQITRNVSLRALATQRNADDEPIHPSMRN